MARSSSAEAPGQRCKSQKALAVSTVRVPEADNWRNKGCLGDWHNQMTMYRFNYRMKINTYIYIRIHIHVHIYIYTYACTIWIIEPFGLSNIWATWGARKDLGVSDPNVSEMQMEIGNPVMLPRWLVQSHSLQRNKTSPAHSETTSAYLCSWGFFGDGKWSKENSAIPNDALDLLLLELFGGFNPSEKN